MKCPVGPRDKLNILHLHLQKTHWHKSREDADLQWQAPIPKATWPFDHATNVKWRQSLKNLYFHYHKISYHLPWQGANNGRKLSTQTLRNSDI